MALKKYTEEQAKKDKTKYEKSGVESPKTKNEEMLIVVPYEINERGEYRCIDEKANWKGWVKYIPEPIQPDPVDPDASLKSEYNIAIKELRKKKELVDLGVLTEQEAELSSLASTVKQLGIDLGII